MNNIPNKETLAAMKESLKLLENPNVKTYTVEEAINEMKSWVDKEQNKKGR